MLSEPIKNLLKNRIKGKILFDEPMRNHTSLRIGGPAEALIIPNNELDLKRLLNIANNNNINVTIIGVGTKLLVSDNGIKGIVVKINNNSFNDLSITGNVVKVGAGYSVSQLSRILAEQGLSGLEFAVGIPGTVGGGVVMNAGAHGYSMSNVITSVATIDFLGEEKIYSKEESLFGYRKSVFQNSPIIVVSACMTLNPDHSEVVSKRIQDYLGWRANNQPLDLPNAGSIFKNPPGLITGKLIAEAGLGGTTIGGAKISEKRGNFIINLGNASASDVKDLIDLIKTTINKKYKVKLEYEIRLVGFND